LFDVGYALARIQARPSAARQAGFAAHCTASPSGTAFGRKASIASLARSTASPQSTAFGREAGFASLAHCTASPHCSAGGRASVRLPLMSLGLLSAG
ncbi:hypothetical protein OOZ19_21460, partial [Saccharopolyspora sp. NFXS83]|uniref:hypothetical protein n=1 Tax=Saccharopolyspora sp. NFXS83 TaxID=2993560 RepID=UPI00224AB2CC